MWNFPHLGLTHPPTSLMWKKIIKFFPSKWAYQTIRNKKKFPLKVENSLNIFTTTPRSIKEWVDVSNKGD